VTAASGPGEASSHRPGGADFRQVGELLGELDLLCLGECSGSGDETEEKADSRSGSRTDSQGGLLSRGPGIERLLAMRWEDIVGTDIAQNSAPVRLTNGRLVVTTSSAAWAQTLQLMAEDIRQRTNDALQCDAVRGVVFRHAGWEHRPGRTGQTGSEGGGPRGDEHGRHFSEEEKAALRQVETLDLSPALKEKIARAMRVSFVRGRQDLGR
jgi:hypothetical protein